MELQIAAKNMELSETVTRHLKRKLSKLDQHLPNIVKTEVQVSKEKAKSPEDRYIVQFVISTRGATLRGVGKGLQLYTAIDKVIDVMNRQIERYKTKLYDKGRGSSREKSEVPPTPETEPIEYPKRIVKTKRFVIKPMSIEEAMEQMELLGHSFFIFFNAATEEFNVLYQRWDGDYGIIEPELA